MSIAPKTLDTTGLTTEQYQYIADMIASMKNGNQFSFKKGDKVRKGGLVGVVNGTNLFGGVLVDFDNGPTYWVNGKYLEEVKE